jgi:hypothetical protein
VGGGIVSQTDDKEMMMKASAIALSAIGLISLVGCTETTQTKSDASSTGASSRMPTPAEQACLRDVTNTTNNPDVVLLDSSFSQAGTEVIVGVGPQRARWRCIAYSDGTTAGIESLTDEGAL